MAVVLCISSTCEVFVFVSVVCLFVCIAAHIVHKSIRTRNKTRTCVRRATCVRLCYLHDRKLEFMLVDKLEHHPLRAARIRTRCTCAAFAPNAHAIASLPLHVGRRQCCRRPLMCGHQSAAGASARAFDGAKTTLQLVDQICMHVYHKRRLYFVAPVQRATEQRKQAMR